MISSILPPPFCRDCRWLETDETIKTAPKMRVPDCLRPNRQITDVVWGQTMLTSNVVLAALADRTCVHPGACGREAVFFEPHL